MLIIYQNISKMKGQSSTNILALQFLQTHKYLEKKIITPKTSKINFYNLISTLFKKLYYNQEIPRFHNKLQSSLKILPKNKKMKTYHQMKKP